MDSKPQDKLQNKLKEVTELIPHRAPFLWVDEIVGHDSEKITTKKFIPADLDIFNGHYPDYPILPGVIICEALFQSGALLIAKRMQANSSEGVTGVPVVARIQGAKFKREVRPGDTLDMEATLVEEIGNAWCLKGKAYVNGKLSASVEFICMQKPSS